MDTSAIILRQQQELSGLVVKSADEYIEDFVAAQDVKQSSRNLYRRTIRQYIDWLGRNGKSLNGVTRADLIEYKDALLAEGKSTLTISSYVTSLRKFYEWAEANFLYPNIAKSIHNPKRTQQFRKEYLRPDQATDLIEYCKGKSLRDYAIINLLLRTGMRTIEVVRADVGDITFKGGKRVLMVQGKGRLEKDNFVILTDKAYQPIAEYLKSRGKVADNEPLFLCESNHNNKQGRLTTRTISFIAKEGLKAIGLDGKAYTAHSLRHTAGVNILKASGWNIEVTQRALRHTNPATTQIYTALAVEEERLSNSGEVLLDSVY